MDEFKLDGGGRYVVTGVPVLAGDLTDVAGGVDAAAAARGGGGDGVRAGAAVPGAAAAAAAGVWRCARCRSSSAGCRLLGLPLTMASIAVLPVLLGLAVDYAIQYQARATRGGLRSRRPRWRPRSASSSCCCRRCRWCAGSGRCWWSGSAWRWLIALTAGTAVLVLARRRRAADGALARSLRGAGDLVDGARGARGCCGRAARPPRGARRGAASPPRRSPSRACAVCGWALDTRIAIVSDLPRLVPQDLAGRARPRRAAARDRGRGGDRRARRGRAT